MIQATEDGNELESNAAAVDVQVGDDDADDNDEEEQAFDKGMFARSLEAATDVDKDALIMASENPAIGQWISLYRKEQSLWTAPNERSAKAVSTAVPYSLLYVLSTAEVQPLPEIVSIHLLGATFSFEGRSQWALFKHLLQQHHPQVKRVSVLLDLAEPYMADNTPAVMTDKTPADQTRNDPGLRPLEADKPFRQEDACGAHGVSGLTVTCIYGNYQDNLAAAEGGKLNIEKPTMVVMFNPGLGQPIRRTWDPVLRYLLNDNITTIISTQLNGRPGRPGEAYDPFQMKNPYFTGDEDDPFNDETRNAAEVMRAYGARLLQATVSPFPIIFTSSAHQTLLVHNAVLSVYRGREEDVQPCKPEGPSRHERAWLRELQAKGKDSDILQELTDVYGPFVESVSTPACPNYDLAVKRIIFSREVTAPKSVRKVLAKWRRHPSARIQAWDWMKLKRMSQVWSW